MNFVALKTHSTVSYFRLNFDFRLKLQMIPEIKKKYPKYFTEGFTGEIVARKFVRACLYQTSIQVILLKLIALSDTCFWKILKKEHIT